MGKSPWPTLKCVHLSVFLPFFVVFFCTLKTPKGQKNYYLFTDALPSACNFCLAIQILAVLIAPVIAVYRVVVNLKPDKIKVLRIIVTVGVVLFAILVLVVAAIISAGLTSLCNKLNDACPLPSKIDCVHFQKLGWDPDFDGSAFYDMTKTAESAAWVSFVLWTALAVWFSVLFLKSRRRPSLREKNAAAGSTPVDVPI
ncbi:transmembrane protein 179B-like [Patiria miniata]|uniref:Uncharacterized protein n=1 Tax=Patiria miniata TaxID=46514 RepID=A0A913ZX58_PATMI|nr:transmembrane protein 179B-like [Patiria miniata]